LAFRCCQNSKAKWPKAKGQKLLLAFIMRYFFYTLLAFTLLVNISCAQNSIPVERDTDTNLSPGTIRMLATVKTIAQGSVTVDVIEVTGTGQGIVNIISPGQTVTFTLSDTKHSLKANDKIDVQVKEEMGIDASKSSYKLLNAKKVK
jgi:hypothetical protein